MAAVVAYGALQSALSAYALFLSYLSISNTLPYEPRTKQAAQVSNIADEQLFRTRTTLAAGTTASLLSLLASLSPYLAATSGDNAQLGISVGVVAALVAARAHVNAFWHGKVKVPLVGQYNDAITSSNQLVKVLGYVALSWTALAAYRIGRLVAA